MPAAPPALSTLRDVLACPVCARGLDHAPDALRCAAGHGFDIARQGYVSLLAGGRRAGDGDTADMVAARTEFLQRGHYEPIATAVADAVLAAGLPDGAAIVDLAGGTGYYLAAVLDRATTARGVSLDISPYASRRAARAHPRAAAVRADVWQALPVRPGSVDAVLSVFGPRNPEEIARVLTPGSGRFVVVTPGAEHLRELVGPLGLIAVDPDKDARLAQQLAELTVVDERELRYEADMTRDDARHEALMGPSAHHVNPAELTRAVEALPETTPVTIAVTVRTYRA